MRPLTYKTKVWIYVTLFTATMLSFSFVILALAYYWFSLNSFKKELVLATKQIINNHLVYQDNQILFKRDSEDRTISATLRDENVSAILFDENFKSFAAYGVYQKILIEDELETKIDMNNLKTAFENNQPSFYDVHFFQNEEYFVLNTPILVSGRKVGIIQTAIMTPFFSQIKSIGFYLILSVLLFSLMVSWPLSNVLVGYLFSPLEKLVTSMEQARLNNLSMPLIYKGHPKDELSTLVDAYNKMLSRLAEGFDRQKDFISHASHELKTPLSRATSSLDVALLNMTDKNYEEVSIGIKEVRDDLFQFSNLIGELLLLSRVDSGMIKLQILPILIADLIVELSDLYKEDLNNHHMQINVSCPLNLKIAGDAACTRLILSNLISNAIKYGRKDTSIDIEVAVDDNKIVTISVKDYGIGMSQMDLLKIFDRFFRSPEVSKKQGFGIGMSLVKQICELHHLTIEYNSVITKGTVVKVGGFVVS